MKANFTCWRSSLDEPEGRYSEITLSGPKSARR